MRRCFLFVWVLFYVTLAVAAHPASPGALCQAAGGTAALAHAVPASLMAAIGQVESGRRDVAGGAILPWPWTVNAEGQGTFYDSKAAAIDAVRALQDRGVHSIDVGCMQVNLLHHPNAFASLEQAFDPAANADYAARFLHDLYVETGGWPKAAAMYHSATPEIAADYQRKVMAAWSDGARQAGAMPAMAAWAGSMRQPALLPPRQSIAGRIMPMARPSPQQGKDLASYRAAPVMAETLRLMPPGRLMIRPSG